MGALLRTSSTREATIFTCFHFLLLLSKFHNCWVRRDWLPLDQIRFQSYWISFQSKDQERTLTDRTSSENTWQLLGVFSLQLRFLLCEKAKMAENNLNLCSGERSKAIHSAREERRSATHFDVQWRKDYGDYNHVFLSHSGKQKNFVRQLYRDLTREQVSCFFDEDHKSLPLGEKFPPRIFEAAETCKVAVVVLSKEFIRSKWPMLELSTFISALNSEWKKLEESNDTRGEWQDALKQVRSINGLPFCGGENEVAFRDKIVKAICCLLKPINPEFPIQREAPQNQNQSQTEVVHGFLKAIFASASTSYVTVFLPQQLF